MLFHRFFENFIKCILIIFTLLASRRSILPTSVVFFLSPQSRQICISQISWVYALLLEHGWPSWSYTFRENWSFLTQQLRIDSCSWARGWNFVPCSLFHAGLMWMNLVIVLQILSSYVHLSCCAQKTLFSSKCLLPLAPTCSLSLFYNDPWIFGCDIYVLFRAGYSIISYFPISYSLHWSNILQTEAFLMKAERSLYLWI